MCGQREDAEEVAQDTLLKVFESFDQLRDPEKVRSWVFRIAKNYCLMKRRKSMFAPEAEVSLDEEREVPIQVPDSSDLPEDHVLRREMSDQLVQALRALPDGYRSVVLLREMEGLSTAETAELLDLSEDAVKQRLHRARAMLRQSLHGYVVGVKPSPLNDQVRAEMRCCYETRLAR
jgi:RNA polymerase sigma-70 factor (ECF subfamily)